MKKKEYYNKIVDKKALFVYFICGMYGSDEEICDTYESLRQLKENFVKEYAEEVINCAYENCNPNFGDGVVFLTPEGEITGATLINKLQTYPNIDVYRLSQNWIVDIVWQVEMLLDSDEWNMLKETYGEEADFLDKGQLETIGVDLDERLKEYLINEVIKTYSMIKRGKTHKKIKDKKMKKKEYYKKIKDKKMKKKEYYKKITKLKEDFVKEYSKEVIDDVIDDVVDDVINDVIGGVHLNSPNHSHRDKFVFLTKEGKITEGGTVPPDILVYRLKGGWFEDIVWQVEMLLDSDEWNMLKETYGEEADFLDKGQLETIGVSLDKRLKEYLINEVIKTYSMIKRGKTHKKIKDKKMKKKEYYKKITKLKEDFVKEYSKEVIDDVVDDVVDDVIGGVHLNSPNHSNWDSLVFLTEEGEISYGGTWTPAVHYLKSPHIVVYRSKEGWFKGNFFWEAEMLLDSDEWNMLKEMYGEEADFLDKGQLETIGVDLDERLKEYLINEVIL